MISAQVSSKPTETLTSEELQLYHKYVLQPKHQHYNPLIHLLRVPLHPRYSPPLVKQFFKYYRVHETRESLRYAIDLLRVSNSNLNKRAQRILRRILSMQDTDPQSPYYGVWPRYWEAFVTGLLRPDLNWAEFLGSYLLQVKLHHGHQLPGELLARIDEAVCRAARAIMHRNVGLGYTNIAVRGTYVTLIAGETYGLDDLFQCGMQRLQALHIDTLVQSGFTEYNSPVYGISTLDALGRLRLHVQEPQAKVWVEDLYRLAWEQIATYFHPPTQQWAGPHSRSYSTLLEPRVLALIEQGTEGRVRFKLKESERLAAYSGIPLPCPVDLVPRFEQVQPSQTVTRWVTQAVPPRKLTTYVTPEFTLGSVSYSDLWHQRRPLLAYWGSPRQPGYLRMRMLCDGEDFAAAQVMTVQAAGRVLAGIGFAMDVNRQNPYIKPDVDRPLVVRDLRLRFEVFGEVGLLRRSADDREILLGCGQGLWVRLVMAYAQFGVLVGQWVVTRDRDRTHLDWVFWTGQRRRIDWQVIRMAGMGMGVEVRDNTKMTSAIISKIGDDCITLRWRALSLMFQPCPAQHPKWVNTKLRQLS